MSVRIDVAWDEKWSLCKGFRCASSVYGDNWYLFMHWFLTVELVLVCFVQLILGIIYTVLRRAFIVLFVFLLTIFCVQILCYILCFMIRLLLYIFR